MCIRDSGWGGQGAREAETILKEMGWDVPQPFVNLQYVPDEKELENLKEVGKRLAEVLKEKE